MTLSPSVERDSCSLVSIPLPGTVITNMASFDSVPVIGLELNRSVVFQFERNFHERAFKKWIVQNWSWSVLYAVCYVMVIFGGRRWMKYRSRFEIGSYSAFWYAMLAAFSVFGSIRTLPGLFVTITTNGLHDATCGSGYSADVVTGFWAALFVISKVVELGDTVFIVLRKQRLIFLHWYHHITVLLYAWYSYADHTACGRWFMVMNYIVHSFMYTYYAFRALEYRSPKWMKMAITTMQIMQMIIGVTLNGYVYLQKSNGFSCKNSYKSLSYAFLMYFTYFILFGRFFYSTYLMRREQAVYKTKKIN